MYRPKNGTVLDGRFRDAFCHGGTGKGNVSGSPGPGDFTGDIKANAGTALDLAMTDAVRVHPAGHPAGHPAAMDSRAHLGAAREAMTRTVVRTICVLSSP